MIEKSSINTQFIFSHIQNPFIRCQQLYVLFLYFLVACTFCMLLLPQPPLCIAVTRARVCVKLRCDHMRSGSTHMFAYCFLNDRSLARSFAQTYQPIYTCVLHRRVQPKLFVNAHNKIRYAIRAEPSQTKSNQTIRF